ncbi:MAG: extracellular solute-binding protein [Treponema sp.]|nr:extracellular solute-binding protein [Treponema sp.]
MKAKKTVFYGFVFVCIMVLAGFTACTRQGGRAGAISGDIIEITIMEWGGDDTFYRDIGSMNLRPDDLRAMNLAMAYAVAKEYKNINPNVAINYYGISDWAYLSWDQHRENFRMEYGVYPDIMTTLDLISDAQRGLIADLSIFEDDPVYQSFHPRVMAMMNVEGRQFGVPEFLLPKGIFINKSLAEEFNIDVPDPDWTIAEFTRFINNSRPNEFYGSNGDFDLDMDIIITGTRDFTYMLLNRQSGEPFVNINSPATRNLLRFAAQWRHNSVQANYNLGRISQEFMDANESAGYMFFVNGKMLTYNWHYWNLQDLAHPDPNHWGSAKMADWDYYPRPSTDYMPNTVGVDITPFVIRNYAMDDGNPELSAEEEAKLRATWDFLKFYLADTRSFEVRARQMYREGREGEVLRSSLHPSFPVVTGPEFQRQMEIWFSPEIHQRFRDREKMPGFHYILELWENGQFWDISDKTYPWNYDFEGNRRAIIHEWNNAANPDYVGTLSTDPNWLDQVYARLPQWNTAFNQRWEDETAKLQEALDRYYPRP